MENETMPERLGDYRLVEEIGGGTFGKTYLAEHVDIGQDRVVIKLLASKGDATVEGENLAKLAQFPHPNVVPFRTMFQVRQMGHCIVMGYVEGESLADVLDSEGYFELADWWPIFKKVLFGVDHIHRLGLIHQDLKPANIIIDRRGEPRIVDLGGARKADGSGTVVYAPGYEAWEVHSPVHTLGPFSDIYTLALVFAEGVFGDRIPNRRTDIDLTRSRLAEEFGPFGESIAKGLMFDPRARPQTITEWLGELVGHPMAGPADGVDDDSVSSAYRTHTRSRTGRGLTIEDLVDNIETRLKLPAGCVRIVGHDGNENGDRDVADALLAGWEDSDWDDVDEHSCGYLSYWVSEHFSLGVEFVNPNGEIANGNLLIRTLKQRHATES